MANGWGMKVLYHNRNRIQEGKPGSEYEYCESLEDMLGRSDVVSLNLPVRFSLLCFDFWFSYLICSMFSL